MRFLDQQTKDKVQAVIDANMAQLTAVEGFVSAEPGFPIIDGTVHKEPAVIVYVVHKKPTTSCCRKSACRASSAPTASA